MKYLCMAFFDEKRLGALSESESQALDDESLAYDDTLRKHGHLVAAQALESVQAATTVRLRNGKVSVTDGPFCRDQRTDRRLHPDRSAGSERGHSIGLEDSGHTAWGHRSAACQGVNRQ